MASKNGKVCSVCVIPGVASRPQRAQTCLAGGNAPGEKPTHLPPAPKERQVIPAGYDATGGLTSRSMNGMFRWVLKRNKHLIDLTTWNWKAVHVPGAISSRHGSWDKEEKWITFEGQREVKAGPEEKE